MAKFLQDREKAIMIGDSGVGKTSILMTYKNKEFNPKNNTTIGADHSQMTMTLKQGQYKEFPVPQDVIMDIHVWDMAGQERFLDMTK